MNNIEKKMTELLIDLKNNHNVVGIKAEFETEGTRMEEALRLKDIVSKAGLNLAIKIGGCEAIKDMHEARLLGVNTIVAPMIESPYAAKKYIKAVKVAFKDEEERENIKFLINIETKYAMQYLEEILSSDYAKDITGIVFGRTDMAGSLNMTNDDVDSNKIFEIAKNAAHLTRKYNKELVMGGAVTRKSLPFFKKLPKNSIQRFETRKVIFDAQSIYNESAAEGILKAFEFEILWVKNKQKYYGAISKEDEGRIETLQARAKLC